MVTLSTYNTWIQFGRLQNIYHFQIPKLNIITSVVNNNNNINVAGTNPNFYRVAMAMVDNTA
jgi:hypothetical protein